MAYMEGDTHVVTIDEALSYIQSLPANTKETAYDIKITGGDWENENHRNTLKNCGKQLNKFVKLNKTRFQGVTDMSHCFYGCTSLVEAPVIPQGVTNMKNCFSGCTSLVEAPVIPQGVTNMKNCFSDCTNITSFLIPVKQELLEPCFVETIFDAATKTVSFYKNKNKIGTTTVENTDIQPTGSFYYFFLSILQEASPRRALIQECLSTVTEGITKIGQLKNAVIIGTKNKTNTFIKGVNFE